MKINKKFLRKLPRSHLELLAKQACLDEVEQMIYELSIIKNRTVENISANSIPFLSEKTIKRILSRIYNRTQVLFKIPIGTFVKYLEKPS